MLLPAATALIFLLLWVVFLAAAPPIQRGLRYAGHWTAEFRYRDYLPVVILLGAGIILTGFVGDEFLDLAELVQGQSPLLQEVDTGVHEWAASQRSAGATVYFTAFAIAGGPVVLSAIVVSMALVLLMQRRARWAAYLIVTTGIGSLLVTLLKIFFARARPDLSAALRHASGYSFPSGHAMGSTIVCGALAYLALRALPAWRSRAAALAAACTFVIAVSLSRIYLGVHWISDVGAGLAAGLVWITATTVAYEAFRRIRLVRALRARRDDLVSS